MQAASLSQSSFSDIRSQIVEIATKLLEESGSAFRLNAITANASLQNHLGLDSLTKAEFFHRVEHYFKVQFPDNLLCTAERLEDVIQAVLVANPQKKLEKHFQEVIVNDAIVDPSQATTLLEVLMLHAEQTPDRVHIYFQKENGEEEKITYGALLTKARQVAAALQENGLEAGDLVAIMLPTDPGFFYSFFGILLAKGIPVPIYPPLNFHQIEKFVKRAAKILANAEVRFLITFEAAELVGKLLKPFVSSLKQVKTVSQLLQTESQARVYTAHALDNALVQYTSGSTSDPKGILLTHQNILANIRAYGEAIAISDKDVCVSWLPLYHDLGLIGNWLGSLYAGVPLVLFSPLTFLNRPEKWLWAIHHYRATISSAPNFGYELCTRKIDAALLEGLDLSSWRIAINGAEVVHPETIERFNQRFAPYGLKPETMFPVYGLAETALGLTTPPLNRVVWVDKIDRAAFEKTQHALPSEDANAMHFVSCGRALPHHEIRILNDERVEVAERIVGRLFFRGPSSMQGYYNNPTATAEITHEGWLDSGDLAYRVNDEYFIVGRKKDVIIKAGHNLFPIEIETACAEVEGIRKGCVIAFSVNDAEKGTEKLIIVAEANAKTNHAQIKNEIREKVISNLNITIDEIILVPVRSIPKTSSGKLQRSVCKKMYLENQLHQKNPVWRQLSSIATSWLMHHAKSIGKSASRIMFSAYVASLILAIFPFVWLGVVSLPNTFAAKIFKAWNIFLRIFSFLPVQIKNKTLLKKCDPAIYVANHASYLDLSLLVSILPAGTRFVGKKSLFKAPILKTFLRKLGYIAIDKENSMQGAEEIKQIANILQAGHSVCLFPEGTFSYAKGLRPFKLGAFKLAAMTGMPICPIAINGTRKVLRGEEKILNYNSIKMTVGEPIFPKDEKWDALIDLKNAVREHILEHCGEQNLDMIIADKVATKKKLN